MNRGREAARFLSSKFPAVDAASQGAQGPTRAKHSLGEECPNPTLPIRRRSVPSKLLVKKYRVHYRGHPCGLEAHSVSLELFNVKMAMGNKSRTIFVQCCCVSIITASFWWCGMNLSWTDDLSGTWVLGPANSVLPLTSRSSPRHDCCLLKVKDISI